VELREINGEIKGSFHCPLFLIRALLITCMALGAI
jgi:hypothetical protein